MKRWLPLLLLTVAAAPGGPRVPILSPERIKADVHTLSADDFHGRGPTQPGEAVTLDFLDKRFAALGFRQCGSHCWLSPALAENAAALELAS